MSLLRPEITPVVKVRSKPKAAASTSTQMCVSIGVCATTSFARLKAETPKANYKPGMSSHRSIVPYSYGSFAQNWVPVSSTAVTAAVGYRLLVCYSMLPVLLHLRLPIARHSCPTLNRPASLVPRGRGRSCWLGTPPIFNTARSAGSRTYSTQCTVHHFTVHSTKCTAPHTQCAVCSTRYITSHAAHTAACCAA